MLQCAKNSLNKNRVNMARMRRRIYSSAWQTIVMVLGVVFASGLLVAWLLFRSLYLPELKNHANYLAHELARIQNAKTRFGNEVGTWLIQHSHLQAINPPNPSEKPVIALLTDILAQEVSHTLGRNVQIYFKFRPTPSLWIHDGNDWYVERVGSYSQYSLTSFVLFLVGLPLLTALVIWWLVRKQNRPLKNLERAATSYIALGIATTLPTEHGPMEIRRANTAFNRLFSTLAKTQQERTIMLAGISHDLRTPLTRMRLTAEMIPDKSFKEGLIYDIEDMDAILDQFISFMRDGSDEAVKKVRLDNLIKEIMVQFSDIEFIYDNPLQVAVPIRPLSIKRLIINLVNNAIRYGRAPIHLATIIVPKMDEQGVVLTPNNLTERTLVICVKDCGDGVEEDHLTRIMQPFERGDTARTTQGTGLGLAIVSRIAALHQGTVEAINHPEGGLQVCVHIPLFEELNEN